MKFLVDRCAGRNLAEWLRGQGHDVVESRERGEDPGDDEILQWATSQERILVTIDKDFGTLVFRDGQRHSGLVRLPDVPSRRRIELMDTLLREQEAALTAGAVITVRGGRVRVSYPPEET